MRVLILGGGGFLGRKLARALAMSGRLREADIARLVLADLTAPAPLGAAFPVETASVDIRDAQATADLIGQGFDVIYHLAAVVSGQAEAEFDLGMQVNLFGALNVFEAARALGTAPVVVFTSSVAAYGGDVPEPIEDWYALEPQSSYGAQKAAAELLLNDYSRKGFLDGRGLRLPTISIRPGKPNKAASSFMSSIFREPLQGREAVCPVTPDFALWCLSPRRCVESLVHGAEIDGAKLGGFRAFGLPGLSVTIEEMVEAMRRVAGEEAVARIRWEPDPAIQAIVGGWKARFNPDKALSLGFLPDASFEDNLKYFLEDDIEKE